MKEIFIVEHKLMKVLSLIEHEISLFNNNYF